MAASESPITLSFVDDDICHMSQGWYRWVHVMRFRFDPTDSHPIEPVLSALFDQPEYRHTYTGSGVEGGSPYHGPFAAERLRPSDFEPSSPLECDEVLRAAMVAGHRDDYEISDIDVAAVEAISDFVHRFVDRAEAVFRLRPSLRAEAEDRDIGWVLGPFHEFVAIGDGLLSVIVASDD